jgi:Protein of unknown function (DUF2917)
MNTTPKTFIRLQPNRAFRINDGKGMVITGRVGVAWLTLPGNSDDIFLGPGDAFTIDKRGLVIIEAIEPALLVVQHKAPLPQKLLAAILCLQADWGAVLRKRSGLANASPPSKQLQSRSSLFASNSRLSN